MSEKESLTNILKVYKEMGLGTAVRMLYTFLSSNATLAPFAEKCENILSVYHFMAVSLLRGQKDPQRPTIHKRLCNDFEELVHDILMNDYCARHQAFSAARIRLAKEYYAEAENNEDPHVRKLASCKKQFDAFLVDGKWNSQRVTDTLDMLKQEPVWAQTFLMDAVMLSCLCVFDINKLQFLLQLYLHSVTRQVSLHALVCLVFAQTNSEDNPKEREQAVEMIAQAFCTPERIDDLVELQLQMLRQIEAKDDGNMVNDKLMPLVQEQMRLHPELLKGKKKSEETFSVDEYFDSDEDRALHEEMTDVIKMMFDRRKEGYDMDFFSSRRTSMSPFFNTFSHWFLPFYAENPELDAGAKKYPELQGRLVEFVQQIQMCDVDMYSLYDLFVEMYNKDLSQNAPMPPVLQDSADGNDSTLEILRKTLQNFYRFFMLSPMKVSVDFGFYDERSDSGVHFLADGIFGIAAFDEARLKVCRNLLKHKNYKELDNMSKFFGNLSVDMKIIMGVMFLRGKQQSPSLAVPYFETVAFECPERSGLHLYRMECYTKLSLWKHVLAAYGTLPPEKQKRPDVMRQVAMALARSGEREKATNMAYEIYYLYPDDPTNMRTLIQVLFICVAPAEKVSAQYDNLLNYVRDTGTYFTPLDYFLRGINMWMLGYPKNALRALDRSIDELSTKETIFTYLKEWKDVCLANHISEEDFNILVDFLNQRLLKKKEL